MGNMNSIIVSINFGKEFLGVQIILGALMDIYVKVLRQRHCAHNEQVCTFATMDYSQ